MSNEEMHNLKDRILGEIRQGKVNMRPRLYFTLTVAALVLVSFVVLVISVFIFNFILFSIRLNHQDSLLGFGPRGWGVFLAFFPWTLLLIDIALVLVLETLLRRFRFGYRVPVLYLLGGLVCLTVLTGAVLDRGTAFNDQLFERRHELPPPLENFYVRARHHDIDDSLRGFGIPLPPDIDDSGQASGTVFIYERPAQ